MRAIKLTSNFTHRGMSRFVGLLHNIHNFLSWLTPYIDEIIGDNQFGFLRNNQLLSDIVNSCRRKDRSTVTQYSDIYRL
jgi:c-di-AMP phosphodiesterase-like protein